jgi:uncharacterized protein
MKYLVLIAVLVIAYLVWRNNRIERRGGPAPGTRGPARESGPQEMIACAVCGLHLPRADAVTGSNGVLYCSQEHRLSAGA